MQGIRLIFVGKTDAREVKNILEGYLKRLSRYIQCEVVEIPSVKNMRTLPPKEQKQREGVQILSHVSEQDTLILFDEKGKEYTSREFSGLIAHQMQIVSKRLILVIGGPYGFSTEVYSRAQGLVSLSRMTFSHQIIRIFVLEQLYRCFTLLSGHPYHHD